ncbi:MAG: hypothetical protein GY853_00315 [PVC group bacterium]|nr:hypothetical protein [PVC group bacterium]
MLSTKNNQKIGFKLISFVLIQAFLLMNVSGAFAGLAVAQNSVENQTTLAPNIAISHNALQGMFMVEQAPVIKVPESLIDVDYFMKTVRRAYLTRKVNAVKKAEDLETAMLGIVEKYTSADTDKVRSAIITKVRKAGKELPIYKEVEKMLTKKSLHMEMIKHVLKKKQLGEKVFTANSAGELLKTFGVDEETQQQAINDAKQTIGLGVKLTRKELKNILTQIPSKEKIPSLAIEYLDNKYKIKEWWGVQLFKGIWMCKIGQMSWPVLGVKIVRFVKENDLLSKFWGKFVAWWEGSFKSFIINYIKGIKFQYSQGSGYNFETARNWLDTLLRLYIDKSDREDAEIDQAQTREYIFDQMRKKGIVPEEYKLLFASMVSKQPVPENIEGFAKTASEKRLTNEDIKKLTIMLDKVIDRAEIAISQYELSGNSRTDEKAWDMLDKRFEVYLSVVEKPLITVFDMCSKYRIISDMVFMMFKNSGLLLENDKYLFSRIGDKNIFEDVKIQIRERIEDNRKILSGKLDKNDYTITTAGNNLKIILQYILMIKQTAFADGKVDLYEAKNWFGKLFDFYKQSTPESRRDIIKRLKRAELILSDKDEALFSELLKSKPGVTEKIIIAMTKNVKTKRAGESKRQKLIKQILSDKYRYVSKINAQVSDETVLKSVDKKELIGVIDRFVRAQNLIMEADKVYLAAATPEEYAVAGEILEDVLSIYKLTKYRMERNIIFKMLIEARLVTREHKGLFDLLYAGSATAVEDIKDAVTAQVQQRKKDLEESFIEIREAVNKSVELYEKAAELSKEQIDEFLNEKMAKVISDFTQEYSFEQVLESIRRMETGEKIDFLVDLYEDDKARPDQKKRIFEILKEVGLLDGFWVNVHNFFSKLGLTKRFAAIKERLKETILGKVYSVLGEKKLKLGGQAIVYAKAAQALDPALKIYVKEPLARQFITERLEAANLIDNSIQMKAMFWFLAGAKPFEPTNIIIRLINIPISAIGLLIQYPAKLLIKFMVKIVITHRQIQESARIEQLIIAARKNIEEAVSLYSKGDKPTAEVKIDAALDTFGDAKQTQAKILQAFKDNGFLTEDDTELNSLFDQLAQSTDYAQKESVKAEIVQKISMNQPDPLPSVDVILETIIPAAEQAYIDKNWASLEAALDVFLNFYEKVKEPREEEIVLNGFAGAFREHDIWSDTLDVLFEKLRSPGQNYEQIRNDIKSYIQKKMSGTTPEVPDLDQALTAIAEATGLYADKKYEEAEAELLKVLQFYALNTVSERERTIVMDNIKPLLPTEDKQLEAFFRSIADQNTPDEDKQSLIAAIIEKITIYQKSQVDPTPEMPDLNKIQRDVNKVVNLYKEKQDNTAEEILGSILNLAITHKDNAEVITPISNMLVTAGLWNDADKQLFSELLQKNDLQGIKDKISAIVLKHRNEIRSATEYINTVKVFCYERKFNWEVASQSIDSALTLYEENAWVRDSIAVALTMEKALLDNVTRNELIGKFNNAIKNNENTTGIKGEIKAAIKTYATAQLEKVEKVKQVAAKDKVSSLTIIMRNSYYANDLDLPIQARDDLLATYVKVMPLRSLIKEQIIEADLMTEEDVNRLFGALDRVSSDDEIKDALDAIENNMLTHVLEQRLDKAQTTIILIADRYEVAVKDEDYKKAEDLLNYPLAVALDCNEHAEAILTELEKQKLVTTNEVKGHFRDYVNSRDAGYLDLLKRKITEAQKALKQIEEPKQPDDGQQNDIIQLKMKVVNFIAEACGNYYVTEDFDAAGKSLNEILNAYMEHPEIRDFITEIMEKNDLMNDTIKGLFKDLGVLSDNNISEQQIDSIRGKIQDAVKANVKAVKRNKKMLELIGMAI